VGTGVAWEHKGGLWEKKAAITEPAFSLADYWLTTRRSLKIDLGGKSFASYFASSQTGLVDPSVVTRFRSHLAVAAKGFGLSRKTTFDLMLKYMEKLADEQNLMHYQIYQPIATAVSMFAAICAASTAAQADDWATVDALDLQCELLRCALLHKDPTSRSFAQAVERAYAHVKEGRFAQLDGTTVYPVLQPRVDSETITKMMAAVGKGEPLVYPVSQEPIPFEEWLKARGGQRGYAPLRKDAKA
jgi:hypothetical protein